MVFLFFFLTNFLLYLLRSVLSYAGMLQPFLFYYCIYSHCVDSAISKCLPIVYYQCSFPAVKKTVCMLYIHA